MEKGRLRGRDRTRRIAIDFGRKLAEVDFEALVVESRAESGSRSRSLAELFSFSSKWSLQARWAVQVQLQKALPAISDGETTDGKVNASFIENRRKIQALRVSEARRWRREYGASMEMAFF